MFEWIRNRRHRAPARPLELGAPVQEPGASVGEYKLLYKYLHDRYANRVVLTFAEIEDLLGFALPGPARQNREWWGGAGSTAPRSAQSNSWTLASRTAVVNMLAQSVVFDRT